MPINRKFVDADLSVMPNGLRPGLIEETDEEVFASAGSLSVPFSSVIKVMTKTKRRELAKKNYLKFRRTVGEIRSQGNSSACVGFANAKALEITCTRAFGKKHWHPLWGMGVYNFIGNSYKSGANMSAGMRWIAEHGACALTHEENTQFDFTGDEMGWSKGRPRDYDSKAICRVSKYAIARGADEIETGLAKGLVGQYGRSWHCIPPFLLKVEGNDAFTGYANSWSPDWGDNGIGYDSYRTYRDLTLYFILEVVTPSYVMLPMAA